jgi:two-component system capsular synthesis response regulator RcsB
MFTSVLIAEDHESANISVRKTLSDLGITDIGYAYYCDDAITAINKRQAAKDPYELLITDLSFEEDERQQVLNGGEALIRAAREVQPGIKILVFSAEHKAAVITALFNNFNINGYVRKARRDAEELKAALQNIYKNKKHLPFALRQELRQSNAHDFTPYDITIISQLSGGMLQKEIPAYLLRKGIKPSGLSSIEKRLNFIKDALGFSKNEQLVAYCKDKGII